MVMTQSRVSRREFTPIFLFASTLFVSATLMFILQPMFGKVLLPLLGGASSVWNTCMVFYQTVLFIGYLYAHFLSTGITLRKQVKIHGAVILLSLLILPIGLSESLPPPIQSNPILWLLQALLYSIGLPFFVISSTAPLIQKWFSLLGHDSSDDPYFLYVASNVGSLLALLSYPFILEPNFGVEEQQFYWSWGYLGLLLLLATCMFKTANEHIKDPSGSIASVTTRSPGLKIRLHWLLLAFVPSSLLLGITTFISNDIASAPLLWVIPLALYLITFILVFSRYNQTLHPKLVTLQPWLVIPVVIYLFNSQSLSHSGFVIFIHLTVFFCSVMVCHGQLAKMRPHTDYLTSFYLIMSFGGMLGGMFNTFVAPLIFNTIYEYPLMIIAALMLRPHSQASTKFNKPYQLPLLSLIYCLAFAIIIYVNFEQLDNSLMWVFVTALVVANYVFFHKRVVYLALYSLVILSCSIPMQQPNYQVLDQQRTFYGVLSVRQKQLLDNDYQRTVLNEFYSGSTDHGAQIISKGQQCNAIGYYYPGGPLGQLFESYDPVNEDWEIGIVGLGSGVLASYSKPGQKWSFYELNPAVIDIALNTQLFSFLDQCINGYKIKAGDARLVLNSERNQQYDLLVMDAFTSESIPTHLMTKEAIALYLENLKPNGLLVFHISNRHLDLRPVLASAAHDLGLTAIIQQYRPQIRSPLLHQTKWVVMAATPDSLQRLLNSPLGHWKALQHDKQIAAWTDDFSSVIKVWR